MADFHVVLWNSPHFICVIQPSVSALKVSCLPPTTCTKCKIRLFIPPSLSSLPSLCVFLLFLSIDPRPNPSTNTSTDSCVLDHCLFLEAGMTFWFSWYVSCLISWNLSSCGVHDFEFARFKTLYFLFTVFCSKFQIYFLCSFIFAYLSVVSNL